MTCLELFREGEVTGGHGDRCGKRVGLDLLYPRKADPRLAGTDQKEADFNSDEKDAECLTPSQNRVIRPRWQQVSPEPSEIWATWRVCGEGRGSKSCGWMISRGPAIEVLKGSTEGPKYVKPPIKYFH